VTEEGAPQDVPEAREHRSWWPGWIWSVPVAALLIVGYLGVRQLTSHGPSVTVTFASASGIKPDDTKVQYEGLQVGTVGSVKLQKDMRHVDVTLDLHGEIAGHLGPGTRFWIAGGKPSLTDLSSIRSIVAGPYIGIDPHPGDKQDHYDGLSEPPAVKEESPGTHYLLTAETLGSIDRGSPIYYRDLQVGAIEGAALQPDGRHFTVTAFVNAPFDKLVRAGTHFWNASAVQLSMSGPGPSLKFQSLPALFSGAVDFATPDGAAAGGPVQENAPFQLYDSKSTAENAPGATVVRYGVTLSAADIGGVDAGAPVRLANQVIGAVQATTLQYDTHTGQLAAHVVVALDPTHFALADGEQWQSDPRPQMDALLRHLIDQGLRARIGKTLPLVGADAVQLDFVPQATQASLGSGDVPELPTAPRSDIQGLIASIGGVGAKLNAMPLDQIANDIHQTTQRLAQLSSSPEMKESLQHLDQALGSVDTVAHEARQQVGPILTRLRQVANEAQSTVASANSLIASKGSVENQPGTTGLGNALYELSRAARALREFADYLDRHPEALLRGKGEPG
jgi:paraquat-inducible protein B